MKFLIPKKHKKHVLRILQTVTQMIKLNFSSDVRDTHSVTKVTIMSYYLF